MDEEELKVFDLTTNRIKMPGEITGRLAKDFEADRQDAKIAIEIFQVLKITRLMKAQVSEMQRRKRKTSHCGAWFDQRLMKKRGSWFDRLKDSFHLEDAEATEN